MTKISYNSHVIEASSINSEMGYRARVAIRWTEGGEEKLQVLWPISISLKFNTPLEAVVYGLRTGKVWVDRHSVEAG